MATAASSIILYMIDDLTYYHSWIYLVVALNFSNAFWLYRHLDDTVAIWSAGFVCPIFNVATSYFIYQGKLITLHFLFPAFFLSLLAVTIAIFSVVMRHNR